MAPPPHGGAAGRRPVHHHSVRRHPARQWHPEAAPEVADEPLHLTLALRPVGLAQARAEAAVPGEVEEPWLEPVPPAAVAVPLDHDGAHVVVEHLPRHAAEGEEGVLVAGQQRLEPLVGDEFGVGRPAPAEGGDEHRQPVRAAPDHRPVHLHLLAGGSLEAHDRPGRRRRRSEPGQGLLEDRVAARVAALAQLPQQRRRLQALRRGLRDPHGDVGLERRELARPRRPRPIPRRGVAQVAPRRVPRRPHLARDLPNALAVLGQHPDLHRQLSPKHPGPRRRDGAP